ncbi:UNVERIFIED_CONTAM: hypothetical protein FKN15_028040 [Acipenser sinensis]
MGGWVHGYTLVYQLKRCFRALLRLQERYKKTPGCDELSGHLAKRHRLYQGLSLPQRLRFQCPPAWFGHLWNKLPTSSRSPGRQSPNSAVLHSDQHRLRPPAYSDVPGLSGGGQNWLNPASAPSVSKSAATLASMEGEEAIELAQLPPVDSTIVALVRAPPVGGLCKDPVCHNGQCRIMEAHRKKAYVAEVQVTCLANTGGFLMAYLDGVLRSVALPEPLASELCTVSDTLLQILGFQGQALGRSLAGLVVVRCQLWPSQ